MTNETIRTSTATADAFSQRQADNRLGQGCPMIPTQDPTYTAMHLLRHVKDRPISVYFGLVRGRKPSNALLGGSADRQDLVKALPQESLVIGPTTRQETLAAAITAVWARLAVAIRKQVAG